MLELKECNPELLDDLPYIKDTMVQAAVEVGAHIIGESFHQFHPQGVTGVLAIAESHIAIHTWPEHKYAAADVFTCGESFDPRRAAQLLIDKLESKDSSITELKRGVISQPVASS
jgi:S-adenosylmethionine decarboxylase